MRKLVAPFVLSIFVFAAPAHAALFTLDSFTVTLNETEPGLVVWASPTSGNMAPFELNAIGESVTAALFQIGTAETALAFHYYYPREVDVTFNFSTPSNFNGAAQGITGAAWFGQGFGYVAWDNPLELSFGNTGLLGVSLSDAQFGLPGAGNVDVTFSLLQADTPIATPEPATSVLFGLGGLALAAARRRRQRATTATTAVLE